MTPTSPSWRLPLPVVLMTCAVTMALPVAAREPCFDDAGRQYHIDPLLLRAIAEVESAMNPRAINHNRNGSEDVGLMQINSMHLPRLNDAGITRAALLEDACLSVQVAADILSGLIKRFGYTWRAVGAYNAGNGGKRDWLRERYAVRVARTYRHLVRDAGMGGKEKPARNLNDTGIGSESSQDCS